MRSNLFSKVPAAKKQEAATLPDIQAAKNLANIKDIVGIISEINKREQTGLQPRVDAHIQQKVLELPLEQTKNHRQALIAWLKLFARVEAINLEELVLEQDSEGEFQKLNARAAYLSKLQSRRDKKLPESIKLPKLSIERVIFLFSHFDLKQWQSFLFSREGITPLYSAVAQISEAQLNCTVGNALNTVMLSRFLQNFLEFAAQDKMIGELANKLQLQQKITAFDQLHPGCRVRAPKNVSLILNYFNVKASDPTSDKSDLKARVAHFERILNGEFVGLAAMKAAAHHFSRPIYNPRVFVGTIANTLSLGLVPSPTQHYYELINGMSEADFNWLKENKNTLALELGHVKASYADTLDDAKQEEDSYVSVEIANTSSS